MNARALRAALMGVSAVALAWLGLVARAWVAGAAALPVSTRAASRPASRSDSAVAPPSLSALVAHDLFRMRRAPAAVPYDPIALAAGPPPPPLPKPALVLDGIAWSAGDAQAVLEGVPGTEGPHVVRAGDVLGGLTIRRIAPDRVVVTGMDTTWTLIVRKP